jgi:hypothetical protein
MPKKRRHILQDFEIHSVALFARWTRWLRANVRLGGVGRGAVFAPGFVLHRLPALPALP